MKQFIITNRVVSKLANGTEVINNDGTNHAIDTLRFGVLDPQTYKKPADITLYPEPVNVANVNYAVSPGTKNLSGSAAFFSNLFKLIKGDVLVYIHGFNNDLGQSIEQLKDLEDKYIGAGSPIKHIVLFSWPSNGKLLQYRDDARDAELSGYSFGRSFLKLTQFLEEFFTVKGNEECGNKIHLMCQSMGNFVFENAVKMVLDRNEARVVFDQIILTAPDISYMALERPNPLSNITSFCKRAHIYFDTGDTALGISSSTKNAAKRLGKNGPFNGWNLPRNVYIVDTSETKLDPKAGVLALTRHYNFRFATKVRNDMKAVLRGEHAEKIAGRTYIEAKNDFRL